MKQILGEDESLSAKYTYVILATLAGVIVILVLAKIAAKVGGDAAISREVEG